MHSREKEREKEGGKGNSSPSSLVLPRHLRKVNKVSNIPGANLKLIGLVLEFDFHRDLMNREC